MLKKKRYVTVFLVNGGSMGYHESALSKLKVKAKKSQVTKT